MIPNDACKICFHWKSLRKSSSNHEIPISSIYNMLSGNSVENNKLHVGFDEATLKHMKGNQHKLLLFR